MAAPAPPLDSRTFAELVEQAKQIIRLSCPGWSDLSPHDPGMVLIEAFAHLTEILIYRLNRLPEKAYQEFLRLLGVRLQPAAAAVVTLRFSIAGPRSDTVTIPQSTRVTTVAGASPGAPPVFITAFSAHIPPGQTAVEVVAYHCEMVSEAIGIGTGLPGQSFTASRPFVLAGRALSGPADGPTQNPMDLCVGIEVALGERTDRAAAIVEAGKTFRLWQAVEHFTPLPDSVFPYVVDRALGLVTFAPAARWPNDTDGLDAMTQALAPVPPAGREIRVWGPRGGGPDGNVAADTLTVLLDALPDVAVTNPERATGGATAETLENALIRGPAQFRSVERAVTASDYENLALRASAAIARATAFTKADTWSYAKPGTVEVVLVPMVPSADGAVRLTQPQIEQQATETVRKAVEQEIENRQSLGTRCDVSWAHYKRVAVKARVVVHRADEARFVQSRLLDRLYQTMSPLPSGPDKPGWPFGLPLRISQIYDLILSDPGVNHLDGAIRLLVDEVPEKDVAALLSDPFQPHTFYAGSSSTLFRSLNDGASWEAVLRFPNEQVVRMDAHPQIPGLLAVATSLAGTRPDGTPGERSRVYLSWDCGGSWQLLIDIARVNGLAFGPLIDNPLLYLATETGLYRTAVQTTAGAQNTLQQIVDLADPNRGLYAVAAALDPDGRVNVAVATMGREGIYLSAEGGQSGTFRPIGPTDVKEDIRILTIQRQGPRSWLWAGIAARGGDDPGRGGMRWELRGAVNPPEGWQRYSADWVGGSCLAIAFQEDTVLAASYEMGVLRLDLRSRTPAWKADRQFESGLPLREAERLFQPVRALSARTSGRTGRPQVLAGGPKGVYRSTDASRVYECCSRTEFDNEVQLPSTWLFCSGDHSVDVVSDDAI